ncbi:MAG: TrkH family potassium uptake protein [Alphaproteobacteria bacterium]|nr:TrkH family potassium uptake protein [Alphaproteobacteria bacterium]
MSQTGASSAELVAALRRVARPVGAVTGGMAAFMLLCAFSGVLMEVSGYHRLVDEGGTEAMWIASIVTFGAAALLWRAGLEIEEQRGLSRRDATLAVALIWFGAGLFGGLPFVLGAGLSPADAFFEAASGFTTTGATILADIEGTLSRPLLLWRSLIQWLGGMGVVVLFVAVFPNLGVGGKHMFRSEVPGPTAEGLVPRIRETSIVLWGIYAALTALEFVVLWVLGALITPSPGAVRMDVFQAVCHALTTMSTGGFSPLNASVAGFQSPLIEVVISAFMLVGGVNYALYHGLLTTRSWRGMFRSGEFRMYVVIVSVSVLLLTLLLVSHHEQHPWQALRYALFQVASMVTSTGYVTDDYMAYPAPGLGLLLVIMFVGAMSGSTAGGIKVSRILLLGKTTWAQIRRSVRPSVVVSVRMSRKTVPQPVLTEVAVFFFVYMLVLMFGVLLVAYTDGTPLPTGFGAMLTTLSNMGPAPFYLEADHFAAYSDVAKLWFAFAMILGRLEFFTLLALLLPDFWSR